jgi:hypothetical protein
MRPPRDAAPAPLRAPTPVAFAVGAGQLVVWGSSFYLLAVLATPIATDTGWAPGWIAAGLSIGLAVAGLVSRRVGRLIDARGGRGLLAASAALAAVALLAMAAAPSLPFYLGAWAVMGVGMGCGLYDPAFATLGRLYGARARTAITQLTLVAGFSSTICWPVTAALAERLGWRGACLTWAVVDLLLVAPLYLLAVPRARDLQDVAEAPHRHAGPAVRDGDRWDTTFLALAAIVTGGAVIMTLVATELLVLLRAGGLAAPVAVAVGALFGPSQVIARLAEMLTGGRYHPVVTMLIAGALVAAGLIVLLVVVLVASGTAVVLIAAAAGVIAYGAGTGLRTIARGTVPLALYGARRYPVVMGRLAAPALVGQAVAPVLGAVLVTQLGAGATTALLAAGALLILVPVAVLLRASRTGAGSAVAG